MPVITTYNPLGEGLDAAASAIQGGNDARDKALALARAREQTMYDRGEDQKRDQATADDFTERKSEFGQTQALNVQRTEADISHQQHQEKIDNAVEATRAKMAPLLQQAQALQLQVTRGQITQDQARTQGLVIANQTAKAQASLEAQFGKPMAEMALAQAQANYASTQAGTASTQQSIAFGTLEEPSRMASLANPFGGTGTSGGSVNLGEAYQRLSPQGRQFYDMLSTTNNPATPGQALAALTSSGLSKSDRALVALMLSKKGASTVTPAEQRAANKTSKQNPAQGLVGLPAPVQDVIIKQRKQGVDDAAILQMINGSKLSDDVKATAKRALTSSVSSAGGSQDAAPFLGSLGL